MAASRQFAVPCFLSPPPFVFRSSLLLIQPVARPDRRADFYITKVSDVPPPQIIAPVPGSATCLCQVISRFCICPPRFLFFKLYKVTSPLTPLGAVNSSNSPNPPLKFTAAFASNDRAEQLPAGLSFSSSSSIRIAKSRR